jgi:hypothetical protein
VIKSDFGNAGDDCILNPGKCSQGFSVCIWERVLYDAEVIDVIQQHPRRSIFSTGPTIFLMRR